MNQNKSIYWFFGILSFLVTLVVYAMTVQPSVPFWDTGEFTAAATWQQVPHPPGAPLFLVFGKIFQIIIPFGDLGWRVNMVSVVATAFTIFLTYLIAVKMIKNFRNEPIETVADQVLVYGSAFVGALALCFSDTMWFNGVESEVYAASTLFTALVIYLMMKWNEEADKKGHERYLLLIAYMIGLSTGVHLLAILTMFSLVLLVYFRKYPFSIKSLAVTSVIALVCFFIVYQFIIMWLPTMLAGDSPFKNEARERIIENSPIMTFLAIGTILAGIAGLWYGIREKKPILKLSSASFLLLIFGFTTYTQVLIRSNANSPMNENEPKTLDKLISYLGREQYGESSMWPRRSDYNDQQKISIYNMQDEKGEFVYGRWFPPDIVEVPRKDGYVAYSAKWNEVNFGGEMAYLWKYQIDHMYLRYFFWNFVGRTSDLQDSEEAWWTGGDPEGTNWKSGFADQFPVRFFALPLLFGLIGLYYQFKKDKKMGIVFLLMFLLMGVLAAIAQNQQDPQPRERDYFYAGSFLVWCLWISMGVYAIYEWIMKEKKNLPAAAGIIAISTLLVPVNMGIGGWNIHTRAGNYLPFDYSYNILQSCEKDAILFTNGNNDTFPLWYLQDVEGVRQDVRVVNLSLGNTLWYVDQLKNRSPWGAKKIPLSFPDSIIQVDELSRQALRPKYGKAEDVIIPVRAEIIKRFTDDTTLIRNGSMKFTFIGTLEDQRERIYRFNIHNLLILDILKQTKWERPVYFANTVGPDVYSGLQSFLRYEGMAARICPVPNNSLRSGILDEEIMTKSLLGVDNSDNYSKTPKYGFKLRNLDNHKYFYYDDVHRRYLGTYRQLYMQFAEFAIETKKDKPKAVRILDAMNKYLSPVRFPMLFDDEGQLAELYKKADAPDKAKKWAQEAVKTTNELLSTKALEKQLQGKMYYELRGYRGPYKSAAQAHMILGDYAQAREKLTYLYNLAMEYFRARQDNPEYRNELQAIQRTLYDVMNSMMMTDETELTELKNQGKMKEAQEKAASYFKKYQQSGDPFLQNVGKYIDQVIIKLGGTSVDDSKKVTADTGNAQQPAVAR